MNRKKLIPLLLFLLLLLLILCVWCHSGDIVKNKAMDSAQVNTVASNPVLKKDIDFNFVKKENNLELTGHFSSDKNNTPVVIPGPTAQELADIKAKQEASIQKAKLEADAEKARIEDEEKARLEAEIKAKAFEEKIKRIISFEDINFELNKATLTESSINTVSKIATVLNEHPKVQVEIGGHSDNTGDPTYNLSLSQKRVDAVKSELINMQISAERIKAIGYGATKPLVSNDTKENRRINRRVEFKVIGE